jgi:hypothetical protein
MVYAYRVSKSDNIRKNVKVKYAEYSQVVGTNLYYKSSFSYWLLNTHLIAIDN